MQERTPLTAVILTAGFARRMRPLTDHAHKTLLDVGGTTILGRIVDALLARGVDDVVIVTGYRDAEIRDFVHAKYPGIPFRFVHNARYRETNNIVSLSLAFAALDFTRDVVLVESDLLFDPSVLDAVTGPGEGNLALVDRYGPGMDGTVVAAQDGWITQVFPSHLQGESFRYDDKFKTLNIYRFDRRFCRDRFRPLLDCYANLIDGNVFYELVLGMLVNMQRERIRAVEVRSPWVEVDDPNDLAAARFTFEPGRRAEVLDRAAGGLWAHDVLDFHFLRNMHFPTDAMLATLRQALPSTIRSYGSRQSVVDQKLAWHLLCDPARVRTLHGAAQAFPWLATLFADRPMAVPEPTFGEWTRLFPHARRYDDRFGYDLDTVADTLPDGGVLVVVNPNNPTGTETPTDALVSLARRRPGLRLVVDESFVEFSSQPSLVGALEEAPLDNVLVVKSLSKTLGVPGLRLGYLYTCDRALLARVDPWIPIWNLGGPAEFFLETTLKFRPELARSFERTRQDRDDLVARLSACPVVERVQSGGGDFVLAKLRGGPARGPALVSALVARDRVWVKDVSDRLVHEPATWLRLAVRVPDDHRRLCDALERAADVLRPEGALS